MKRFTVTVTNPERAADWQSILGRTTVSVRSPIPSRANLPGHLDAQIYLLDLDALTVEETNRLVAFLAQRFNISESDVVHDLHEMGVPILAEDCIITILNSDHWLD